LAGKARCGGRINARRAMQAAASGVIPQTCGASVPDVDPTYVPGPAVVPQGKKVLKLFAILDSNNCAEWLKHGPNPITESSAAYFSTADGGIAHSKWVQKIMPTGVPSPSDIEIVWQFAASMTLAKRFDNCSSRGEKVTWSIKDRPAGQSAALFEKRGTFWFADAAHNEIPGTLVTRLQASGANFSSDDGAWGAASGNVNGNCVHDPARTDRRKCPTDFWGIFREHGCLVQSTGAACDERQACSRLYRGSMSQYTTHPNMRVHMYFETSSTVKAAVKPAWVVKKQCSGYQMQTSMQKQANDATAHFMSMMVILSCIFVSI
jgi:hypothetical protein